MAYTFKPEYEFSKGIAYAEFFDPATDNLLSYSQYVTDFALNGSMNDGAIEGGLNNMLIMNIPDTSRLAITARTADAALNSMAAAIGAKLHGGGIIETGTAVTATGNTISAPANATAPLGGQNGAVAYVLTSSGSDKAAVEAASGIAYKVGENGVLTGFTAVSGNTYCIKYFVANSSAQQLDVPAAFTPKVMRAHFCVNVYAKKTGSGVMESSLYKKRHYYIPFYYPTAGLQDSASQTTPGSVDLSGNALSYEEAIANGVCADTGAQYYGFIVDEFVGGGDTSTAAVEGIYFIGIGDGVSVAADATIVLPVKYAVSGALTEISDMEQVTFSSADASKAKFDDEHANVLTGVAAGNTTVEVSVTNSVSGVTYKDTIPVTVT